MTDDLTMALGIAVAGMSLVFGVLALLWGLIALMVRLMADRTAPAPAPAEAPPVAVNPLRRRQAATAAVAVALALSAEVAATGPNHDKAMLSPWQSAMRGRQLRERGRLR